MISITDPTVLARAWKYMNLFNQKSFELLLKRALGIKT